MILASALERSTLVLSPVMLLVVVRDRQESIAIPDFYS